MASWDAAVTVAEVMTTKTVTEQQVHDAVHDGSLPCIQPPYRGIIAAKISTVSDFYFEAKDVVAWTP